MHYTRVARTGSVHGKNQGEAPPPERLLRQVTIDPVSGCWLWTGAKDLNGYGRMRFYGRTILVHRFAFELWNGPLDGAQVDHRCHDPLLCTVPFADCPHHACVCPDHLAASTNAENSSPGRSRSAERNRRRDPEAHAEAARRGWEKRRARFTADEISAQAAGAARDRWGQ